jgi:hypothetical protein
MVAVKVLNSVALMASKMADVSAVAKVSRKVAVSAAESAA